MVVWRQSRFAAAVLAASVATGATANEQSSVGKTPFTGRRALQHGTDAPFAPRVAPMAQPGFPDSTRTGVPDGMVLVQFDGPATVTTDRHVIDGVVINGSLRIVADDVIIRNSRIEYGSAWGIDAEGAANITIQDCTFIGPGYRGQANAAILGSGTFLRNDISNSENGIVLTGGASTVKGNYIHDLASGAKDPHYDGISVQGGQNGVLIEDNTVIGRDTSDIFIKNDFGPISSVTVKRNFLAGSPGFNIYVDGRAAGGPITDVSITNNYMWKGGYGYYSIDKSTPDISDNIERLPNDAHVPNLP